MNCSLALCLLASLSTVSLAQTESSSKPIAYAYVTTGPSQITEGPYKPATSSFPQIVAYTVASDGQLTLLQNVSVSSAYEYTGGVANKKFFFALSMDSGGYTPANVSTFAIGSNGKLTYKTTTSVLQSSNWCYDQPFTGIYFDGVTPITLDASEKTLYVPVTECSADGSGDQAVESYEIESDGALKYLGVSKFAGFGGEPITLGNDKYAYVAGGTGAPYFVAYTRASNGLLSSSGATITAPSSSVHPVSLANDSSDHVAVAWSNGDLGSYTAGSNGDLTTSNKKMPSAGSPILMSISPDNKFLGVISRSGGMQVFNFEGSGAITPLSGVFYGGVYMNGLAWDASDHLFADSVPQDIYVLEVTSEGAKPATGSPYVTVDETAGYSITVVPLT